MKLFNKAIALTVSICFLITNVVYGDINTFKLAAPTRMKDMEFKTAAQVIIHLRQALKDVRRPDINTIRSLEGGEMVIAEKTVFDALKVEGKIFFRDAQEGSIAAAAYNIDSDTKTYIIPVVMEDENYTDIYYCLVSADNSEKITVLPARAIELAIKDGRVKFTHDTMHPEDRKILYEYIDHEISIGADEAIDPWIAKKMQRGEYAVSYSMGESDLYNKGSRFNHTNYDRLLMNQRQFLTLLRVKDIDAIIEAKEKAAFVLIPYNPETEKLPTKKIGDECVTVYGHSSQFATYVFLPYNIFLNALGEKAWPRDVTDMIMKIDLHETGARCGEDVKVVDGRVENILDRYYKIVPRSIDPPITWTVALAGFHATIEEDKTAEHLRNLKPVNLLHLALRNDYAAGEVPEGEKRGIFKRYMAPALVVLGLLGGEALYVTSELEAIHQEYAFVQAHQEAFNKSYPNVKLEVTSEARSTYGTYRLFDMIRKALDGAEYKESDRIIEIKISVLEISGYVNDLAVDLGGGIKIIASDTNELLPKLVEAIKAKTKESSLTPQIGVVVDDVQLRDFKKSYPNIELEIEPNMLKMPRLLDDIKQAIGRSFYTMYGSPAMKIRIYRHNNDFVVNMGNLIAVSDNRDEFLAKLVKFVSHTLEHGPMPESTPGDIANLLGTFKKSYPNIELEIEPNTTATPELIDRIKVAIGYSFYNMYGSPAMKIQISKDTNNQFVIRLKSLIIVFPEDNLDGFTAKIVKIINGMLKDRLIQDEREKEKILVENLWNGEPVATGNPGVDNQINTFAASLLAGLGVCAFPKPDNLDIRAIADRIRKSDIEIFMPKSQFYKDNLKEIKNAVDLIFGDRLTTYENIEDLADRITNPGKTIVMTVNFDEQKLLSLGKSFDNLKGVRFMNFKQEEGYIEELIKQEMYDKYIQETLSKLLVAREITSDDAKDEHSPCYQLMAHLLDRYLPDNITMKDYISLIANDEMLPSVKMLNLITQILKSRPIEIYKYEELKSAITALWSA